MSLTKTVNYTQGVRQSLGFNDELSGLSGEVRAVITFNPRAGRLNTGTYGAAQSVLSGRSPEANYADTWEIVGSQADVNAALNALQWFPRAYDAPNAPQDVKSADRDVGDSRGERVWQLHPDELPHSYLPGDTIADNWTVTRDFNDGERIGVIYNKDYALADRGYVTGVGYETVPSEIKIVDDYIIQPSGNYFLDIIVYEDETIVETGQVTLSGTLFVQEPVFDVEPPGELFGSGLYEWTNGLNLAEISQPNNELVYVQLLQKRHFNDLDFEGNLDQGVADYIEDESYGLFNEVLVDNRVSETYPDGAVRWQFYGTPEQCIAALKQVRYFDASQKDFFLETRIVTDSGRIRISHTRGAE